MVLGRWGAGLLQLALFLAAVAVALWGAFAQIAPLFRSVALLVEDGNAELAEPLLPVAASLAIMFCGLSASVIVMLWSVWDAGKESASDHGA